MRKMEVVVAVIIVLGFLGCGKEQPAGVDKVTQLEKRLAAAEADNAALAGRITELEKLAAAQSQERTAGADDIAAVKRDIEGLTKMAGEDRLSVAGLVAASAELKAAYDRIEKALGAIGVESAAAEGPVRMDQIEVKGITLTDDSGAKRATLGMGEDGAALTLYGAGGQRQAEFVAFAGGSRLVLLGDKEGTYTTVVCGASPALAMSQDGAMGTVVASRSVTLMDERGRTRAAMEIARDKPAVSITDENGQLRAMLGHGTSVTRMMGAQPMRTESSFVIYDNNGQVTWFAP
jgi:hypothetical protein